MIKRPRRMKPCGCGCGIHARPGKRFINGHNARAMSAETKERIGASRRGKKHAAETRAKISNAATNRKATPKTRRIISIATSGNNNPFFGKKHTEASRRKMSRSRMGERNHMYGRLGEASPMFGKTHTEESKAKMSISSSGDKHPNWQGGISYIAYCPEFCITEYKQEIFERDNNRCQNPLCWGTCMKICRHHINYDKKDCRPDNLITVCISCNSRANYNREFWQEHYESIMKNKTKRRGYEPRQQVQNES